MRKRSKSDDLKEILGVTGVTDAAMEKIYTHHNKSEVPVLPGSVKDGRDI